MFDTEGLERVLSVMMLGVALTLGVLPSLVLWVVGAILAADSAQALGLVLGLAVVAFPSGLLFSIALIGLTKRSRTGRAAAYLEAVGAEVGGRPRVGSMLWPLMSPRLVGEVGGHPYRLTLRRHGGILSAADPGRRFLIFGWMYELGMSVGGSGRVAFATDGVPTVGLGLLGISGPAASRGGLATFACGTEAGETLIRDEAALAAAAAMVSYGRTPSIVRWNGTQVRVSGFMPDDGAPESLVAFLRAAGALADRIASLASGGAAR